jgi:hypothetical protein
MMVPRSIPLSHPIALSGVILPTVTLRSPGRTVVEAMAAARPTEGFGRVEAIRFGSRLSGHAESTLRRIHADDLDAIARALDVFLGRGQRQVDARRALAKQAKVDRDRRAWNDA